MNIALLLFAIVPQPSVVVEDRYDAVEINHYYDGQGNLLYDQIIFYDWSDRYGRFVIQDGRRFRVKPDIAKNWKRNDYAVTWTVGDGQDTGTRSVKVKFLRDETWTQHDPMVEDQQDRPASERRLLSPAPEDAENDPCGELAEALTRWLTWRLGLNAN